MAEWTYYAGGIASLEVTLDLIQRHRVLWRSTRNSAGALIANVQHLRPGDVLHFAYRQKGEARYVFRAVIGEPHDPILEALAFDRIGGEEAAALRAAGYEADDDGRMDVLRLVDIEQVEGWPLVEPPPGRNALRRGGPRLWDRSSTVPAGRRGGRPRRSSPRTSPRHTVREAPAGGPPTDRRSAFFDSYLAVDWSASSRPTRNADSIWIAEGSWSVGGEWREEGPVNCLTRQGAAAHLQARLALTGRILLGFDFAFGYTGGFAGWLPGDGEGSWLRVGSYLDQEIVDAADNRNNRNEVAAAVNRLIGGGPGPFWGCHEGAVTPELTSRRPFGFPYLGLAEYRLTDRRARIGGKSLQSVWKICRPGSVGGQTLMGIPYLMRLRAALRACHRPFLIWPFETGWSPAAEGITAVEIFPTLVAGPVPGGEIKDRHQVRQCIRRFAELDAAGELAGKLARPEGLNDAEERRVRTEEGWILLS